MKKIILVLLIFFALTSTSYSLDNNTYSQDDILNEQINNIDFQSIDKILDEIDANGKSKLSNIDIKKMLIDLVKGEGNYSVKSGIEYTVEVLFREIVSNSHILAHIIILSLICTLLNNLSSAFESDSVAQLAYMVCYLLIITLAIKNFSSAISIGNESIENMLSFMQALFPILITFIVSTGSITTATLFQPIIFSSISIVSTFMQTLIMPLIFFTAILSMVNNLSSKIHINRLSSLLREGTLVAMGFILTLFSGVIAIKGVTSAASDGLTLRTARFAVESFVPVVGGFISDAFDTIIGCSVLLKNAVGIIGIIILLIIVSMPLIKILSLIFLYKISAAIIEPITDSKLVNCLNEISKAMVLVFAVVSSVAIMFFLAVTIIIGTGNLTLILK
ncbi:MAG: stage III sporulation protein AE [Anaeromicrobium sp.]|jgi:stage III sporulation protein AE|uniref:stage III sporulation protein AE n=1 Tax=Anaeromicrobium sp. TaxID=1929132 RepID=UPI0025E5E6DD|nr:stage III sporulation protein AE [Anaeromicrobium sp.]MCT4596169.1 stage III sporulation protein AE [Anaeromicrobium sp.]